jgi:RNA polymerase sigma-70 factor (ECF subfamily)
VKAYRDWGKWRGDAPAEAWVHRIAINTAISHQRYERMREAGQLIRRLGRPGPPPDPSSVVERSDLVKALQKLSPKLRAAIVLRHHHGYTNREIGAALGIPERTVASRLAAAKEQLRQVLGHEPEVDAKIEVGTFSEDGVPSD